MPRGNVCYHQSDNSALALVLISHGVFGKRFFYDTRYIKFYLILWLQYLIRIANCFCPKSKGSNPSLVLIPQSLFEIFFFVCTRYVKFYVYAYLNERLCIGNAFINGKWLCLSPWPNKRWILDVLVRTMASWPLHSEQISPRTHLKRHAYETRSCFWQM
jgi:hypothetical protein